MITAKKTFAFVHALLMVALLIGVPVVVSTSAIGKDFSFGKALAFVAITIIVILSLIVLNFVVQEFYLRSGRRKE
jgi:hypothetical protein